MPKRYNLTDFKQKQRENAIVIEVDDGREFTIDPPELWTDETLEAIDAGDALVIARALLGDRYDEFREAGGSAAIVATIASEAHGAPAPE